MDRRQEALVREQEGGSDGVRKRQERLRGRGKGRSKQARGRRGEGSLAKAQAWRARWGSEKGLR